MEDATASEELNEWEQIQSTTPTQTRRWVDVVVMRDNYLNDSSTFPPSNHEGLPITPQDNQSLHSSPSSASDEGDDGNAVSVAGEIGRRLRLHLRLLSSGVYRIAFTVRNYALCRGGFWSFVSVTGVLAALLMSLVYVNLQRWRRRIQQENKDLPILLIREKDEKIKQLLLQIAQMNELLSARRRVPVLRVG